MIARARSLAYRAGLVTIRRLPAHVVSVGNISFGGTGKSPFTMLLAERAAAAGVRTAVLSRGYGREQSGLAIVGPHREPPGADRIGDEPRMIKRRVPGISLLVHPDRGRMALAHWRELGSPQLVLLDDGFQHWKLARDRDVVMLDAAEGLRGRALPFGRRRESREALARADLLVVTRAGSLDARGREAFRSELSAAAEPRAHVPWKTRPVAGPGVVWADYELADFVDLTGKPVAGAADRELLLVSGIAKPEGFRALARNVGLRIREEMLFPDHHRLGAEEVRRIAGALARLGNGALLLTEKDWARWQGELGGLPGLVLRVRFRFLEDGADTLDRFVRDMISEAKRCSISG